MKYKLIAISGKLKNGKDTFANLIINEIANYIKHKSYSSYYNHTGKPAVKISFADPIKEAVWKMFPDLTKEDLWGPSQNRSKIIKDHINPLTGEPLTIRDCLTSIGNWGRNCNINFWVNLTIRKSNLLIKQKKIVIISDCRFKNEKEAIEKNNGIVFRIIRPDVDLKTNDISETDLDDVIFDNVVVNDSIENLKLAAKEIAEKFILDESII